MSPDTPDLDLESRIIAELEEQELYRIFRYFGVVGCMFMGSVIAASNFWPDRHDALIVGIIFLYCTAMVLLFLKHCDKFEEELSQELILPPECHETTWVQMLVVTGIMLISLVLTTVYLFPIKWGDLAVIVLFSLVATTFSFLLIIHCDRKRGQKTGWPRYEVMPKDLA